MSDRDIDALLLASRALVGVAAHSLADLPDDVTLPQFRVLVLLSSRGALTTGDLADALGVHPSTASRLVDRLVGKRLVVRRTGAADRRTVVIELAPTGRRVVARATATRRHALEKIVGGLSHDDRDLIGKALGAFAGAAGEAADDSWALGWSEH